MRNSSGCCYVAGDEIGAVVERAGGFAHVSAQTVKMPTAPTADAKAGSRALPSAKVEEPKEEAPKPAEPAPEAATATEALNAGGRRA